jgi:hypothetical protein
MSGTAKAFEEETCDSIMTLATVRESGVIGKELGYFSSTKYITRPERQAHFVLFGKSANRPADGRLIAEVSM